MSLGALSPKQSNHAPRLQPGHRTPWRHLSKTSLPAGPHKNALCADTLVLLLATGAFPSSFARSYAGAMTSLRMIIVTEVLPPSLSPIERRFELRAGETLAGFIAAAVAQALRTEHPWHRIDCTAYAWPSSPVTPSPQCELPRIHPSSVTRHTPRNRRASQIRSELDRRRCGRVWWTSSCDRASGTIHEHRNRWDLHFSWICANAARMSRFAETQISIGRYSKGERCRYSR